MAEESKPAPGPAAEEKKKSIIKEFEEFINRGNVMDLAVGVIIGGAFTSVVNSLVDNVVQPLISFLTGGTSEMPGLSIDLNGSIINFGTFISSIINFLITAVAVFAIVKLMNKFNDLKEAAEEKLGIEKEEEAEPEPHTCPYCLQEISEEATRCPYCTSKLKGYKNPNEKKKVGA